LRSGSYILSLQELTETDVRSNGASEEEKGAEFQSSSTSVVVGIEQTHLMEAWKRALYTKPVHERAVDEVDSR